MWTKTMGTETKGETERLVTFKTERVAGTNDFARSTLSFLPIRPRYILKLKSDVTHLWSLSFLNNKSDMIALFFPT